MKKKNIATALALATVLAATPFAVGCSGDHYSKLSFDAQDTTYAVTSQGGSAVSYGNYVYFINGTRGYEDSDGKNNVWDKAIKGGLYRAELLGEKIRKHGSDVYLINTGWTGGGYGVGKRMSLPATRAIVTAALNGSLNDVEYEVEPFFGLAVPKSCPGVDSSILNPKNSWADKAEYDRVAKKLAAKFVENFQKYPHMPEEIVNAGPKA